MNDAAHSGETLTEQLERELGAPFGTALVEEMRLYLTWLQETEDLGWVDLVVWRLTEEGVPLPEGIQRLAADVAQRRLCGEGRRGGKATKVWKKFTERVAHSNAAFLQGALGVGAEEAYDIAANAVGAEAGYAGKASTVSRGRKKYAKEGPVASVLIEIGAAWAESNPEQLPALKEHNAKVPKRDPGSGYPQELWVAKGRAVSDVVLRQQAGSGFWCRSLLKFFFRQENELFRGARAISLTANLIA